MHQILNLSFYNDIKEKVIFITRNNHGDNFDNTDSVIFGIDVIHPTAHLAHIMGCTPIILTGVDLQYQNNKEYCKNNMLRNEIINWGSVMHDWDAAFKKWEIIKKII